MALYDALHGEAAVADRSASDARLRVSGPDRGEWLQGLLTNDIAALTPGQGCYAAYLTPQGRMIGDMRVFHRGDHAVLDVPAAARETLLSRLDQFIIMEDVVLEDVTAETACVTVAGPRAAAHLAPRLGVDGSTLEGLREYAHVPLAWDGAEGFVAATLELGVPGFDVYLPPAQVHTLVAALQEDGLPMLSEAVLTTARVEAGRPRFGVDMGEDTIPLEANIEARAISMTKGCYVGQEVVIRVLHRGQGRVARRLCWIVSDAPADRATDPALEPAADPAWRPGMELRAGDKPVGRLTSVCVSPARARWLAIGMVHRDAAVPGTAVVIEEGGAWSAAVVHALAPAAPHA